MSLSETSVVDQICVEGTGTINVRTTLRVERDGVVIAESYHRQVVVPGDDLTDMDERVVAVAKVVWTDEVIEAYRASRAMELRRLAG
jgi:hypothetical protein